jgi:dCTP deaminase
MLSAPEILAALASEPGADDKLTVVPWPDRAAIEERGATSIDLRLGRWFRSFKQTRTKSVALVGGAAESDRGVRDTSPTKQHFVPFGESYVLHPGRFVLGATLEWLHLPRSLSGYVTGKSSLGRHGLVIETAAGIHPLFSGCLTLELANVGEVPLEIYPGMLVCQIFLHRTVASDADDLGQFSGRRKPILNAPRIDPVFERLRENPAKEADGHAGASSESTATPGQ